MDNVDSFIDSFLNHGNRIYDPIKAHKYYEDHKKLLGRRSGSQLRSKKQKEGWAYVQARVHDLKKGELDSASANSKAINAQLQATGDERRKTLSEKIQALMDNITSDVKGQIDALPAGLSKEDRAAQVAAIRAKGQGDRASNKSLSQGERDQLSASLKSSVDDARANYKKARDSIAAKYEKTLQSEFDALRTNAR